VREGVDHQAVTPIFIFSLPRSGSTLLQRLLATHDQVATASEPWLLLPYMYALREEGCYAEYGHRLMADAVTDFCVQLPHGRADYLEAVRVFAEDLYGKAGGGKAKYFVDKTPRYHMIVDDIIDAFPDGKFVFLWRNPLAVSASMMETWGRSKWNLFHYHIDLFAGLASLADAFGRHRDNVFSLRYEDMVAGSDSGFDDLFGYLGLSLEKTKPASFRDVELGGKMGDVTGRQAYREVSEDSLHKWQKTMHNPLRKAWCRRYLRWIGAKRLALMGYDHNDLLKELDKVPLGASHLGSDLLRMAYGNVYLALEPHICKRQLALAAKGRKVYAHT
jgi:hypothetical protein